MKRTTFVQLGWVVGLFGVCGGCDGQIRGSSDAVAGVVGNAAASGGQQDAPDAVEWPGGGGSTR